MRLGALLKEIDHRYVRGAWDGIDVCDVAYDSRCVRLGSLFVCIPGVVTDGHDFAADAVRQGAAALLVTRELLLDVPQVVVEDARDALAAVSAAFFGNGSARMDVVGVTGTAGKTTVTYMVEHMVRQTGGNPGLIGTTGYRFAGHELPATLTTPVARDLQELLGHMADAGCNVAALEVSSHAISTRRCAHTRFAVAAFTNLSREHMELHGTMEHYFQTKLRLLTDGDIQSRVVCAMDEGGRRVARHLRERCLAFYEVSAEPNAHVRLLSYVPRGLDGGLLEAEVCGTRVDVELKVPGDFNARNALIALGIANSLGLDLPSSARALESFTGAPGRMERIGEADAHGFCVIVDYAHTPAELSNAMRVVRTSTDGRLAVVFGCGGERDPQNRPLMGRIAAEAELAVVTSDNPLSEDPATIARQTVAGMGDRASHAVVRTDRREAIREALAWVRPGDTVLVAGKGHEQTQTVGGVTTPFDDRVVVREELARLA
ncbi:MAG: UDP-N-acetylmuramoyl-L-alanyl-D-glutamate--2,6-diaminopimelate ligase [Coriobacteriales bacterium]|nr:UDP-N-acetylmuramoyl-L-alanyl-D-glutamate--2,6-diaminopimelate ligase [Coriobacteriales bacterium]